LLDVENTWIKNRTIIAKKKNGSVFTRPLLGENRQWRQLNSIYSKAMHVSDEFIYSVPNNALTINKYTFDGAYIETLGTLLPTAWKISDIREKNLLLSQFVAIKHDLVLLQ